MIKKHIITIIFLMLSLTSTAATYLVPSSTTSFGNSILIGIGTCSMAYDTSVLTNITGTICTSITGASRGHYKVLATPDTTVRIVVRPLNDSGNGVVFIPNGVVFSDSTAAIAFSENSTTNIDSGTSGIVEIYVGGELTLLSKQAASTTVNFTYEIDYSEL